MPALSPERTRDRAVAILDPTANTFAVAGFKRETVKRGEEKEGLNPRVPSNVLLDAIEHVGWPHFSGSGQLKAVQTAREVPSLLASGICVE